MPVQVFGVRHLSPMGAWHLCQFLDQVQPSIVLIEGLADAGALIRDIVRRDTKPPIAILAYTQQPPVRTLVYPLASYSPEYQALKWADKHNVEAAFIDLPSDVFLALQKIDPTKLPRDPTVADEASLPAAEKRDPVGPSDTADAPDAAWSEESPTIEPTPVAAPNSGPEHRRHLYDRIALLRDETSYDSFWERTFEHNRQPDAYRLAALAMGAGLRDLDHDRPLGQAENLIREAHMRRQIQAAIAAGHMPEKIVVVVGAYHASAMTGDLAALTDQQLGSLPRLPSQLTLMPYSYFKLSSQSGYGAGNRAPAYFELIWQALQHDRMPQVATEYLTRVARHLRKSGTHRSTAEVIEGVRLANTLSAMRNGSAPVLQDLQDAAVTLIGHGQASVVSESLARVEVGTEIGSLPKGVSQTSIQEDFERHLLELKLSKFRSPVKQDLALDLRENRQAKTTATAFLDLRRSSFLNRLQLLGVPFGVRVASGQANATWAEAWQLQWTPETEISLVEAVLLGETIDLAASFQFARRLEKAETIADASRAVRDAFECGMFDSLELARGRLQALATESSEIKAIATAAEDLSTVVRYGDVRRFDPAPLLPLIEQLFLQGSLGLLAAAHCDNEAAKAICGSIESLEKIAAYHFQTVDDPLWRHQLRVLADSDDRNPLLSGFACSILLEHSLLTNDDLAREVSRRLSPGIPADLGAGWFEGMAMRNRYALLARQALWEQLAEYVSQLDDDEFKRALVFLRRAFGSFQAAEKRAIAENLGQYWGVGAATASELLGEALSEAEAAAMDELNEFDFDDL